MVTSDLLSLNTREVDKRYLAINSLRGYLSVVYVPVCVTDNEQRDVIQSTGCWAMRVEMSRDRNCKLIIDVCLFIYLILMWFMNSCQLLVIPMNATDCCLNCLLKTTSNRASILHKCLRVISICRMGGYSDFPLENTFDTWIIIVSRIKF